MQRRDRQSEVVVAVIAVGVIAVALTFGIVLSLGNQDGESLDSSPTLDLPDVIVVDQRLTSEATQVVEDVAMPTDTPTNPPLPSATATDLPTQTPDSPTLTPTLATNDGETATPEATNTDSPSPTPTATTTSRPTSSNTPTQLPTATLTSTFTITPSFTFTPTTTPSHTFTITPTETPSLTATLTETPTHTPTMTMTMTITAFPTLTITPYFLAATQTACESNPNWEPYVVQPGDILFEIALASGLRTDVLRQGNCIEGSDIIAGQTILVPPDSPLIQAQVPPPVSVPNCRNAGVQITYPLGGDILTAPIAVRGIADNEYFFYYVLRVLPNPDTVFTVYESNQRVSTNAVIGTVNVPEFPQGTYTLRLVVYNQWGDAVDYCDVAVTFAP